MRLKFTVATVYALLMLSAAVARSEDGLTFEEHIATRMSKGPGMPKGATATETRRVFVQGSAIRMEVDKTEIKMGNKKANDNWNPSFSAVLIVILDARMNKVITIDPKHQAYALRSWKKTGNPLTFLVSDEDAAGVRPTAETKAVNGLPSYFRIVRKTDVEGCDFQAQQWTTTESSIMNPIRTFESAVKVKNVASSDRLEETTNVKRVFVMSSRENRKCTGLSPNKNQVDSEREDDVINIRLGPVDQTLFGPPEDFKEISNDKLEKGLTGIGNFRTNFD